MSGPSYRAAHVRWLVGWLAAINAFGARKTSKTKTLSTKLRRTCLPVSRKSTSNCVGWRVAELKNAYTSSESASKCIQLRRKSVWKPQKTRTRQQKVRQYCESVVRKSATIAPQGCSRVIIQGRPLHPDKTLVCQIRTVLQWFGRGGRGGPGKRRVGDT